MRSVLCALVALTACGGPAAAPTGPPVTPAPDLAARVEDTLLAAQTVQVEATIESTGLIPAKLEGTLLVASGGRARYDFRGTFAGEPVELHFVSDGRTMSGGAPAPKALGEAILVGWMRMGLLHNLAVLHAGKPPDHADGGVKDWLRLTALRRAAPPAGAPAGAVALGYVLEVSGTRAGEGVLLVDEALAVPLARELTVHFPEGDMHVVETYRVTLDEPLPEGAFARATPAYWQAWSEQALWQQFGCVPGQSPSPWQRISPRFARHAAGSPQVWLTPSLQQ
jgi:hypothetical protein